jgi:hypothetical protein
MSDRLFACIDCCGKTIWGCANEFQRAAEELLHDARTRSLPIDSVVRPIAFLYRHAFELAIKAFLASGRSVKTGRYKCPSGHELDKLWRDAKPFAEGIFDSHNPAEQQELREKLENINRIAEQIVECDAQSDAFRYPGNKKGELTLPGMKYLDLNAFSSEIKEAMEILGWMSDLLERDRQLEGC